MNNEPLPSSPSADEVRVSGAAFPALPDLEEARLDALKTMGILNKDPIPILEILCRFAVDFCGVSTAAITLVDRETVFFKALAGEMKLASTPREKSFCAHALLDENEIMVIPDTLLDPRFVENEQVTQEPFIRFYAGVRLMAANGHAIGCFCVMDTKPMILSDDQLSFLREMSRETINYLEGEKSKRELSRLLHLEKEVYNKLLLSTADLASSSPTFDEALHHIISHLDPQLGWLSARIRNMQTGGSTGIYYNPSLPEDREVPLIWKRLDAEPSRTQSEIPYSEFINSSPLRPEYTHLVVPVRVRDRLIAVMEFIYPDHRNADPRIRDVFNLIAANLSLVAERELLNLDLRFKSEHDSITGAPNRELFIQRFNRILLEASTMSNRRITLFCFEIDKFQSINVDYGYEFGEKILHELSRRAKSICTPDDMIGRLMGGEFLLLIHEQMPFETTTAVIEIVKNTLNGKYEIDDVSIDINLSIGCVILGGAEGTPEELIRRAEEAMHLVKEGAYQQVCIADEQVTKEAMKKRAMNRMVKDAVRNNDFTLFYQPIVEIPSGKIVGAEALLRLINMDGSHLEAKYFIEAMERMNLLEHVDAWVISEILLIIKNNPGILEKIPNFYFSHNVTPGVISRPDFDNHFLKQIIESKVPPSSLQIEITEQALLPDNQFVFENITEMRRAGIKIALDDFGMGTSNLWIITKYPVDVIKIDRTFLQGIIPRNNSLNSLLSSITDIAKNFGCTMIAEGVEQPVQSEHLINLGCTYAQGYLYGKPMPLNELQALIAKQ
jgi:diguanylate cyclase (GGDEF)-like protein